MPTELAIDVHWLHWGIALAGLCLGVSYGWRRAFFVGLVALGSAMALEEPAVGQKLVGLLGRLSALLGQATGVALDEKLKSPELLAAVWFALSLGVAFVLTGTLVAAKQVSWLSRLFGGSIGFVTGLLCSLLAQETVLPYLRAQLGPSLLIRIDLGREVAAQARSAEPLSLAGIAAAFGILSAVGGIVHKFRQKRGAPL